jgi:hypothetical protein
VRRCAPRGTVPGPSGRPCAAVDRPSPSRTARTPAEVRPPAARASTLHRFSRHVVITHINPRPPDKGLSLAGNRCRAVADQPRATDVPYAKEPQRSVTVTHGCSSDPTSACVSPAHARRGLPIFPAGHEGSIPLRPLHRNPLVTARVTGRRRCRDRPADHHGATYVPHGRARWRLIGRSLARLPAVPGHGASLNGGYRSVTRTNA